MTSHKLSERLEIEIHDDGSAILLSPTSVAGTLITCPESQALYAVLREFWAPEWRRTPTVDDLDSQARRDAFQDPVAKATGASRPAEPPLVEAERERAARCLTCHGPLDPQTLRCPKCEDIPCPF